MSAGAALQVEMNVLLAREADELFDAFLAPAAGRLETAERRAEEVLRHGIDPNEARLHRRRGAMRGDEIVGPDRAGEPVFDLFDLPQHFVLASPFEVGGS